MCGEMPMLYALMWIVLSVWTRELMSWPNFVELERLLQNGLPGLVAFLVPVGLIFMESCEPDKKCIVRFARAMGGSVPFEQALAARLSLFSPSKSRVQEFLETRPPRYKFFVS